MHARRSPANTGAPPVPKEARVRVLGIQRELHKWASDDPQRRFSDLHNLVCEPAVLMVARLRVRSNTGSRSTGVDGQTARHIEDRVGVERFLDGLREELRSGSFRPLPVKERRIPNAAASSVVSGCRARSHQSTPRDVCFENPLVGVGREHVNIGDRIVRTASRPETVGAGFEVGLEYRLEHRPQSSLNNPVANGRRHRLSAPLRLLASGRLAAPKAPHAELGLAAPHLPQGAVARPRRRGAVRPREARHQPIPLPGAQDPAAVDGWLYRPARPRHSHGPPGRTDRQMTIGMPGKHRCAGTRTPGSAGGPRKRSGRKAATAPRVDPTWRNAPWTRAAATHGTPTTAATLRPGSGSRAPRWSLLKGPERQTIDQLAKLATGQQAEL